MTNSQEVVSRRKFAGGLAGLGAGLLLAGPRMALARVESSRRFVFVLQRGAADGLHIVAPYADPAYARLRGALALDPAQASRLDGTFALHPALVETAAMYHQGQVLFAHAVASPYRERSHFDGQNVLETGGSAPYQFRDGWMNRLTGALSGPSGGAKAIAIAPTMPLVLRGAQKVESHAPSSLPEAGMDLLARVEDLYGHDAQLRSLWSVAMEQREMAGPAATGQPRQDAATLGKLAAQFLSAPEGARIAVLETSGWDTHSAQLPRMTGPLRSLDTLLAALRDGLGPVWDDTLVLVATEFGRTAAVNGTGGTDHGTGSVAWLLGGAVRGGRVMADWPGLAPADLFQARDLRPTLDLDALISAALGEHFRTDPVRLARRVFPRLSGTRLPSGLTRA